MVYFFFHGFIMRIGLIMAKCGAFLACIKKYTQQLYLSHVLTSYLHCFSCSDSQVPPRSQGSGADRRCGRDRCHSGGFLLRIMPPSWHPVPARTQRLCGRRTILRCRDDCGRRNHSPLRQRKNRIGRGHRCRYDHCRRNFSPLHRFASLGLKSRIDARKRV